MSNVIPLTGAENGKRPAPLCSPLQPTLRASVTGAGRRLWGFARLWAEGLGWLLIIAAIIAAIR
jgi:hypothetical protein